MSRMADVANMRTENYGEGGAKLSVFDNSVAAEQSAIEKAVPWLLSKLYAPSPIVNMDQTRDEGVGMIPRLYVPAPSSKTGK
jgi:hypothetical protein